MIGARKKDVEAELGIDLREEKESANTAEIFKQLKVRKEQRKRMYRAMSRSKQMPWIIY